MCTGAEIGLILAAAGTGTGLVNERAAAKAQDRQAALGIQRQSALRRQAGARAGEQVESFRESGPEESQAAALASFQEALRRAQPEADTAFFEGGAVNPRFAEDVAERQATLGDEVQDTAGRLAMIDAPRLQRQNEQIQMGRTQSDLGQLADRSQTEEFLNRMRIASRQPNPWVNGLSQLMQGVGTAMAMGTPAAAGGAPATAAATTPAGLATTPAAGGMSIGAAPWRMGASNVPWWQNKTLVNPFGPG